MPAPAPGAGPLTIRDVLIHLKVWVGAVREHQQWFDVPSTGACAVSTRTRDTRDAWQDNHVKERPELFMQADSVRPGVSLSTLHGG